MADETDEGVPEDGEDEASEEPDVPHPDTLIDTLCHYTRADTVFQYILPTGKLRMSPYREMRDPLENRELSFRAGASRYGTPAQGKPMLEITRSIRRMRDRTLLLSFTVDATDGGYTVDDVPFMCAWARPRMWEQYADNHAGVCIAFDRDVALGNVRAELNRLGIASAGPVDYSRRGFGDTEASTLRLDDFGDEERSQVFAKFVVTHNADLFFSKTLDWQTEYEYRVTLFPNQPSKEGYKYVEFGGSRSIRGVILGERFPEWQIPAARAMCDELGVELFVIRWIEGMPWTVPIPFPSS